MKLSGMSATVVSQHLGCTRKTIERLRRRFRVTGTVANELVGHMWPLLPMIAISSCSTYVTSVWLQQQQKNSMVFIPRLSEIGWDKTFNLFVRTDCTSVKFSPDSSNGKADWCRRHLHFRRADWDLTLFSDECRFNLSHAEGRERVYRRAFCLIDKDRFSVVWGGKMGGNKTCLIVINGNSNAQT